LAFLFFFFFFSIIFFIFGFGLNEIMYRRSRGGLVVMGGMLLLALGMIFQFPIFFASFPVMSGLKYLFAEQGLVCVTRKGPLVSRISQHGYAVVWEGSCGGEGELCHSGPSLQPNMSVKRSCQPVSPSKLSETRYVFRGEVLGLGPGRHSLWASPASPSFPSFPPLTLYLNRPHSHAPSTLALIADNQGGAAIFSALLWKITMHQPQLLLVGGDFIQNPRGWDWEVSFFSPLAQTKTIPSVPLAIARGNHDQGSSREARAYLGTHPTYFSFMESGAAFLILDSNSNSMAQEEWLKKQLSSNWFRTANFRVVFTHIPPFIEFWDPKAWNEGKEKNWGSFVREKWVPLFEESGVDLVIGGHQHGYQRGKRRGITYAIVGGGGGALDYDRVEDWGFYDVAAPVHHFVIIKVSDVLEWEVWDVRSCLVDHFSLSPEDFGRKKEQK